MDRATRYGSYVPVTTLGIARHKWATYPRTLQEYFNPIPGAIGKEFATVGLKDITFRGANRPRLRRDRLHDCQGVAVLDFRRHDRQLAAPRPDGRGLIASGRFNRT